MQILWDIPKWSLCVDIATVLFTECAISPIFRVRKLGPRALVISLWPSDISDQDCLLSYWSLYRGEVKAGLCGVQTNVCMLASASARASSPQLRAKAALLRLVVVTSIGEKNLTSDYTDNNTNRLSFKRTLHSGDRVWEDAR
jgi:hypothetical protein